MSHIMQGEKPTCKTQAAMDVGSERVNLLEEGVGFLFNDTLLLQTLNETSTELKQKQSIV